jgi:hypothetical protein
MSPRANRPDRNVGNALNTPWPTAGPAGILRAATTMNQIPKERQLAELVSPSVKLPSVMPAAKDAAKRLSRANPAVQRRMEARQPAESGANHARHHVGRKSQS